MTAAHNLFRLDSMDYLVERRTVRFRIVESREAASKAKRGYLMMVEAMVLECDIINENFRLYPGDVFSPQVGVFNERLTIGDGLGQANHPKDDEPADVMLQAILWTATEMRGREVWGTARVLNTPAGAVVAGIIEGGARMALSSRARGTTTIAKMDSDNPFFEHNQEHDGKEYAQIDPNLMLETFDVVVDPGFRNANVRAYESLMETVRSKCERIARGDGGDDDPKETATMDLEKLIAEHKTEIAKMSATLVERDAEIVTLKEAADAKAVELSEEFNAKLEAVKLSDEDRETLERIKALDADKLTKVLDLIEGKQPDNKDNKDDEPTEQDRKILALETRLASADEHGKLVEQKLQEEIDKRQALTERKTLDEHIAVATKDMPNADGVSTWLRDHCGTPEDVDKEITKLKEQLGLKDVLDGLKDTKGEPKGATVPNAGTLARPGKDEDEDARLTEKRDYLQMLAGGKIKSPSKPAEGEAN